VPAYQPAAAAERIKKATGRPNPIPEEQTMMLKYTNARLKTFGRAF
jgi:hypothetical protein